MSEQFPLPMRQMQPELRTALMLTGAHTARVPAGWSYPRHDHPYFEVGLLLQGEQHTRLTGRSLQQRQGDLLFITPFEAHSSSTPVASSFYCLHFDIDDLELRRLLCLIGTRVFDSGDPMLEQIAPVLRRMGQGDAAVPAASLAWRLEISASLFKLLAVLAASHEQHVRAAAALPQAALQTAERLAAWIEREVELGQETSIASAIRRLGYTPSYGNALFRQVYGVSAQHHRSMRKLRRARLLLLDAGLSIGQVSERLGYSSVAHFSRQFKRWSGISPQAFRQQAGAAEVAEAAAEGR